MSLRVLVMALALAAAARADDEVAQYRGGPQHLGRAAAGAAVQPAPQLLWRWTTLNIGVHTASKSSPVADGSTVYVGADNGQLYAFDKLTGDVRWRWSAHASHDGIHGTPAVDGERVYIGDYAGWLTALDRRTGTVVWETKLGNSIGASPAVVGDEIFIGVELGTPDGYLSIVDRKTGSLLHQSPNWGDHVHASPSVDARGERVYLGCNSGVFHCVDAHTAADVWTRRLAEPANVRHAQVKGTAALVGDRVLFGSWANALHCLAAKDGRELWRFAMEGTCQSSPAVDAAGKRAYVGSSDGNVYAVEVESGREAWHVTTGGHVIGSGVLCPVAGSKRTVLLIGSGDRFLYMLDAANGDCYWKFRARGAITGVPLVDGDRIYVATDSGELLCFR